ncbi:MAG: DUF2062 domain-containing protein [Planctomycetaceae bacterium]
MPHPTRILRNLDPRALVRRILAVDDTPHAIALGVAVGMFVACTPTLGIRMAIVAVFAVATWRWFYFNRSAALLTTCLSNPVTTVPLYYFNYWIGSRFIDGRVSREDFARALDYQSLAEWWQAAEWLLIEVGTPLLLGSLLVASVMSVATYPAMRWLAARVQRV